MWNIFRNAFREPISGAQLFFNEADCGSNVPVNVFADEELQIPHARPVIADANGNWPPIFLDMGKPCAAILKDWKGRDLAHFADARALCGPIPSLARYRKIEALARIVTEKAFGNSDAEAAMWVALNELRREF